MLIISTVDMPMVNIRTCPSIRPPTLRIPSLRSPSLCLPSVRSSSLRSLVMVGGLTCVPFCMGRCGSLACRLRQPLNTCMQFSKGPFFLRRGIVTLETKEVPSAALVRICVAQFFAGRSALLIVHYYEALRYGGRLCSNRRSNALAVCRVSKASTSSCSSESKS